MVPIGCSMRRRSLPGGGVQRIDENTRAMELRHLRYFAAVAETCHFGQAADNLHVAQPALSYAIRQLEAELDTTLFNRTTRQVSLTAAGEFLRDEAARILGGVDDAVRGVRLVAAGRSGLVRLGFTMSAAFSHLPRLARGCRGRCGARSVSGPVRVGGRRSTAGYCAAAEGPASSRTASTGPRA